MEPNQNPEQHDAEIERLDAELENDWNAEKADELASRLASRGGMHSNSGQLDDAMQDLDRAVLIFERLVEREGHGELAFKLGLSLMNRGITLCNSGQVQIGAEDFEKSSTIYTALVEGQGRKEHAEMLQMAQRNLAVAAQHLQQTSGGHSHSHAHGGGHGHGPRGGGPMYDPNAVQPMREELTKVGARELLTAEDVEAALGSGEGSTLLIINSVCGCAAGGARPGAALALQHTVIPDDVTTVFAGMEREAVEKARSYLPEFPASSPFIALFKAGKVAAALQRGDIEGASPVQIAGRLATLFDEHCTREGPSIPREEFEKLEHARVCGSSVPRVDGA